MIKVVIGIILGVSALSIAGSSLIQWNLPVFSSLADSNLLFLTVGYTILSIAVAIYVLLLSYWLWKMKRDKLILIICGVIVGIIALVNTSGMVYGFLDYIVCGLLNIMVAISVILLSGRIQDWLEEEQRRKFEMEMARCPRSSISS